jgi:formate hydrogenlyase subunit 4
MKPFIFAVLYLAGAPIIGGLIAGLDRKITAWMQGRVGPSVLQSFYDVLKLFQKENIVVRRTQTFYVFFFMMFTIFTGVLFFSGNDLLLMIFALTLAEIFLVLAAYKASSPYSFIGAERELIQMMAFEPMIILTAVGMYMVTHSFSVADIVTSDRMLIWALPGVFAGLVYVLTIKLRKSPFDLSTSHHAHQELVKGLTTEFSGRSLAMIEIAHWYEKVLVLGVIYLFFAAKPVLAISVIAAVYFFEILIDNAFARAKWQLTLKTSWTVSLVFGFGNILALYFFSRG